MSDKIENLIFDKNIRKFNLNDTIYINKIEGGRGIMYFCQFIKFKAGVVTAKVISSDSSCPDKKKGGTITATIIKCALYGKDTEEEIKKHNIYNPYYHWFESTGDLNP